MLFAALTLLAGCVSAPTPRMDRNANLPPQAAQKIVDDDSRSIESTPPPKIPPSIHAGTGQLMNVGVASLPPPGRAAEAGGETTFNFEGESLQAVIKAILGDLLQKNYVIAPGVQGTVTLATPSPVTPTRPWRCWRWCWAGTTPA